MVLSLALGGCSLKRMAVNMVGDAISGGGGVWMSDNDPELIRAAIPFGLKTNESLLEVSPEHLGLLEATAQGFTAYAFMLTQEADRAEAGDLTEARRLRARASKLFLRGRDYALRGLEVSYPDFTENLASDRAATLAQTGIEDAGLLYWGGAAWAGALGANKASLTLIAEFPIAGAMVQRVVELDESFNDGSAHEFLVTYEASRPGGNIALARQHYAKALQHSRGERASVHLALAEAVDVTEQNLPEFRAMLAKVRAIDPDTVPEIRLLNTLALERAIWLETQIPELFLVAN